MEDVYDLLGIGLGPFNLGLAALLDDAPADIDSKFLEQKPEFNWHEGMLIEDTTLEVPFLADLVTMADPSNPYSYLNYLREKDRLYEFYFYEEFFIPRREYNEYCRWVTNQLRSLQFERRVCNVEEQDGLFIVEAIDPKTEEEETFAARNLVMGIGSQPHVPYDLRDHLGKDIFHSASYLNKREQCLGADSVTIIGSGQSAAEVFRDLLERQPNNEYSLDWITRSRGFFQLIDAKLGHMIYTPDYIEYFYYLDQQSKDELLKGQDLLYKGIDKNTSAKIYNTLYKQSIKNGNLDVGLLAATEVTDIGESHRNSSTYQMICNQWQENKQFLFKSDVIVLATGYTRTNPEFLAPIKNRIQTDTKGRFSITDDFRIETDISNNEIFVQNAELHTHGINAPDLGLGCYRNAAIINTLSNNEIYPVGRASTFQDFKASEFVENRGGQWLNELPTEAVESGHFS